MSLELWQATHDDVVSHYKSYYTCCNAFWLNLFWFMIASVGGIDKLDSFWGRRDKTRQQRDRESRAANFGRRPRFSGMFFF